MNSVLGDKLFNALMKSTFYGHFVAGEDQFKIVPCLERYGFSLQHMMRLKCDLKMWPIVRCCDETLFSLISHLRVTRRPYTYAIHWTKLFLGFLRIFFFEFRSWVNRLVIFSYHRRRRGLKTSTKLTSWPWSHFQMFCYNLCRRARLFTQEPRW